MHLTCPKCGNKVNPDTKRPQCGKCYYCFTKQELSNLSKTQHSKLSKPASSISDDIMQGNILDALEKANIENSQ